MLVLVTAVLVEVTALPLVLAYDGMVSWDIDRPSFARLPEICSGDHCSSLSSLGLLLDVLSGRSVARATMLMIESILLGCLPVIASSTPTVSLELARYGGRTDLYAMSFFFIPC